MIRAIVIALVIAGCNDPTFALRFRVTDGLANACRKANGDQAMQCQDVPMSCAAVANIRVFNPNTPTSPIINVCQELMMAPNPTLCEIAQVNLPAPTTPVDAQTLQVEIVVYPKYRLAVENNVPVCPATIAFGTDGFPAPSLVPCMPDQPCDPTPAVGGTAFYHPGDSETVVELGCADQKALNDQVCTGTTKITTAVTDFDTLVSVPASLAPQLTVSVGQPEPSTPTHYALDNVTNLDLDTSTGMLNPSWSGQPPQGLMLGCIQVDEKNVPARTDTVRCTPLTGQAMPMDLVGTRLTKASLDEILAALNLTEFPDGGLVVGVVLDNHGNPAAGLQVVATSPSSNPATVQYLSADRHSVGGSVTASGGIFVSQDAEFGTMFSAMQSGRQAQAVSGRIDGKVTIVVLQIPDQTGA